MEGPLRTLIPATLFACLAVAWVAPACAELLKPPTLVQKGIECLPTSAAMALHALGDPTKPTEIARRLPVYPTGTDFFDLQEELSRRGYGSLVATEGPEAVASAIKAGVPVVAAVRRGHAKHAVLVWATEGDGEELRLRSIDPANGAQLVQTMSQFRAAQYANQILVIWPAAQALERALEGSEFPLDSALRVNARFRSEALVLRAERHSESNRQALELLQRAVKEDPTWSVARERLEEVKLALGDSGRVEGAAE